MKKMDDKIIFRKDIYSMNAIKRALSNYTNYLWITINEENDDVIIKYESKDEAFDLKKWEKEILNEILEEDVRYQIECETKEVRELLYRKAIGSKEK